MKIITNPRIELSNDEAVILDTIAKQQEEICDAYGDCEVCPFEELCNICEPGEYFKMFLKACNADPVYGDVESCREVQNGKNLIKKGTTSKLVDKGYTLNPTPNTITIEYLGEDTITFSDGSCITYDHEQDCCEHNYALFESLDDLARSTKFTTPLTFENHGSGFLFGNPGKMFFVPCYSDQNGYYTSEVDIYYNGKKVLEVDAELECD